jgi:hypothetical protein
MSIEGCLACADDAEKHLSKNPIAVSGKIRLCTRQKIFTLQLPGPDSGDTCLDKDQVRIKTMKAKKKAAAKKSPAKKAAKKKSSKK